MKKLFLLLFAVLLTAVKALAFDQLVQKDYVWYDCHPNGTATVYSTYDVPADVTDINIPAVLTDNGVDYLVVEIKWNAFQDKATIENVVIGDNVQSIPEAAFLGCTNLKSLVIGSKVESIGANACLSLEKLESVTIGENVKTIGSSAFMNCTALKTLVVEAQLESIGQSAFQLCKSLTTLRLPSSITSIGYSAFSLCSGLEHVYAERTDPTAYNMEKINGVYDSFRTVSETCVLHIPKWCGASYAIKPWTSFNVISEDLPSDCAPDYNVKNVSVTVDKNDRATVTWDNVYYATSYIVVVDGVGNPVSGDTSYKTGILSEGEHTVVVQSVVDGEVMASSASQVFRVNGKEVLAPTNLQVVNIAKNAESDSKYDVIIRFTQPDTKATVKSYRLFYDTGSFSYVSFNDYEFADLTSDGIVWQATVQLSSYNVKAQNEYTGEDELRSDVPLCLVAVYEEGTSDASNTVIGDFSQLEAAIQPVSNFKVIKTQKSGSYWHNVTVEFDRPDTDAEIKGYKLYYGSSSTDYKSFDVEPLVEVPDELLATEYKLSLTGQAGSQDIDGYTTSNVVIDGSDIYVSGLAVYFPDNFIKGTIENGKATFATGQLIGEDSYGKEYLLGFIKATNEGEEDQIADLVFDYDADARTLSLAEGYYYGESASATERQLYASFTVADFVPIEGAEPHTVAKSKTVTANIELADYLIGNSDGEGNYVLSPVYPLSVAVVYEEKESKHLDIVYWSFEDNAEATHTSVTIGDNFTTYSSDLHLDFSETGVKVYTAKQTDGKVILMEIADGKVPAGAGVILKGETGTYEPVLVQPVPMLKDNELKGTSYDMTVDYESYGFYNYILQQNAFYKATGAKLKKGKAYLSTYGFDIDNTASREMPVIIEGATTDIKDVQKVKLENNETYDLQGRKVSHPTRGIYVVKGKKVIFN